MWLVYVVLFIIFILVLDHFLIDKRKLELSKQFNGPLRLPIIGTIYIFFGASTKDYYGLIKNSMERYGRTGNKIVKSWNAYQFELKVDDYKLLEAITTNQKFLAKSSQYSFMHAVVGEGLLFSTGKKWFNRRRIITPTFHFKILEQFFDIFQKANGILIDKIKKKGNCEAINIFPMITTSVLNSLCETAMGYEMKDKDSDYLNSIREIGRIVGTRFITPWQKSQFLFSFTSAKRQQDKCVKIMREFTTKLIEERRKFLIDKKPDNSENIDDDDLGLKRKMCLLDVLLQSTINDKPLSNEDIQEEVDTFTFAGHDTTSNAICFTLYLISKYPEVQKKINNEIQDVLEDNELTFKHLNDFKYLEMVIKESMRLYPPAPIIARRLFEEVDFEEFIAPANANYNIILYTLFRDPNVFEKPDEFIPERFMTEIPTFAYVPFSAGQRNCIGQKFAMTNVKTTIINIMRNFTLVHGGVEPEVEINVTLKCNSLLVGFKSKQD